MTDAKGAQPWIDRELARLRKEGWTFKDCRQGLVIRPPYGGAIQYFGEHVVTGEIIERATL